MTTITTPVWEAKRTAETRSVEDALTQAGFERVDAYRYNSASIRVRVVDPRFAGMEPEARDALVEPHLDRLPERTQGDILMLLTLSPDELRPDAKWVRESLMNVEFDDPSPSML